MNQSDIKNMLPDFGKLDRLTVYQSRENFGNRRFETRFYGHDEKSVRLAAEKARWDADTYSCPSLSSVRNHLGSINLGPTAEIYSMTLTTHSID